MSSGVTLDPATREGRHYIIYRNTDEGVWVADFVHGSRNLEAIFQDLSELS